MADGVGRGGAIVMPGIEDSVIGEFHEDIIEAIIHDLGITAGQIAAPASVDKKRVTGEKLPLGQETNTAGGVAGGINNIKADHS